MHCVRMVAAAMLTVFGSLAQAPDLQFEVASLKPSRPGAEMGGIHPAPGGRRYIAAGAPLKMMLTAAYRIRTDQVSGGPGWIDTDHFDMNAEAEQPSSIEELHGMLRNLLRERFELQMHSETKERPVYALSVDKSGIKMTPHAIGSAGDPRIELAGPWKAGCSVRADGLLCVWTGVHVSGPARSGPDRPWRRLRFRARRGRRTLSCRIARIGGAVQRPDQLVDASGPGIFEALRTQLGLKLEPQRGPVEILVIDRVAKPVSN